MRGLPLPRLVVWGDEVAELREAEAARRRSKCPSRSTELTDARAESQGLARPPFFWDDPRQDVELAAGSSFTTSRKSSGERDALAHQAEQS